MISTEDANYHENLGNICSFTTCFIIFIEILLAYVPIIHYNVCIAHWSVVTFFPAKNTRNLLKNLLELTLSSIGLPVAIETVLVDKQNGGFITR